MENERELLRRSKRQRRVILVALICAAVAIAVIWPILNQQPITMSQRLIVTADDLGPGWTSTKPELDPITSNERTRPAEVRLGFENGSTYSEVTCRLYIYSSIEQANASYLKSTLNGTTGSALNVGDRAMIEADMDDGHVIGHWLLIMQEGEVVVSMSALSYKGPIIDKAQMVELAEIQAAKIT